MKQKAKQGAEPGSLPAVPPHPSTQPKLNFPAAKSLCADDGFANLAPFSGGSAGASALVPGVSTVEKDGVASLPCPYIALIELIGFHEQVAFRALQGRPICTPSCRGLSRAQALTPRGTGAWPESEAFPEPRLARAPAGPAARQRRAGSSGAPAAQQAAGPPPRSRRTGYSGGICTAAALSFRAAVGCSPSPQNVLWKVPVKHFLQSSLPLRAGCNQTACARGQQAAERQSPALSSSGITMLLTTLYPGAGRLSP